MVLIASSIGMWNVHKYQHIYVMLTVRLFSTGCEGVPEAGLLPSAWTKVLQQTFTLHQLFCSYFSLSLTSSPGHHTCRPPPYCLDHEYFRFSPRDPPALNHLHCWKHSGSDNAEGTVNL